MRLFWKYSCTSRYSCIVPSNICFGCKIQVHLFHFFEVFPGMHRGSSTNKVIFNETHFGKAYGKNPLNSLLPLLLPFHHFLSEETSARSTPSQMLLSDFLVISETRQHFFVCIAKGLRCNVFDVLLVILIEEFYIDVFKENV